jgi:Mn2+/Fe2+ NRAMP family transporter
MNQRDPYIIQESTIKEPPRRLLQKLKFLGPGFILSASIVGSGELIATTVLGARAGFAALWIIIVSCLAKVAVQLEFGKHAILTGQTAMEAFNRLPGPKFGRMHWSVTIVFISILLKIVQVGGILGGAVLVLNLIYPGFSIPVWTICITTFVAILVFNGKYNLVEKSSLVMIGMFTLLTLVSLFSLSHTPYSFSLSDIIDGFQFNLSGEIVAVAIGAFGITGVASDEIIAYHYWCLEKGYAAYTGPRNETTEWKTRANGWINIMYLDALLAMAIYTFVTVAFYLLGAAVLHKSAKIPEGNQVIETLALIYTQSLGGGIKTTYLVGAFFVLFSSIYATLAAWTRVIPDIAGQFGWLDFSDLKKRKRLVRILACLLPAAWGGAYLFIDSPVLMVLSGGIVGSFLLILVIFTALQFKYKITQFFGSSGIYNVAFWISVISILFVAMYGLTKAFS